MPVETEYVGPRCSCGRPKAFHSRRCWKCRLMHGGDRERSRAICGDVLAGASAKEVAGKRGMTRQGVYYHLHKMGIAKEEIKRSRPKRLRLKNRKPASNCIQCGVPVSLRSTRCRSCSAGLAARSRRRDLTGQRFGRLVAVEPTAQRNHGYVVWRCRCDCGREVCLDVQRLAYMGARSCGCSGNTSRAYREEGVA